MQSDLRSLLIALCLLLFVGSFIWFRILMFWRTCLFSIIISQQTLLNNMNHLTNPFYKRHRHEICPFVSHYQDVKIPEQHFAVTRSANCLQV